MFYSFYEKKNCIIKYPIKIRVPWIRKSFEKKNILNGLVDSNICVSHVSGH